LYVKIVLNYNFSEPGSTEGLHRDSGADGDDDRRLLADGLAGEGLLHRHGHQDLRLHQGKPHIPTSG